MSTASIRETLLREVSVIPAGYCPKVLHFIETLKEEDSDDDYDAEEYAKWLAQNPPIPVEEAPTISPEHLERLRQQEKDTNEGKNRVISFDDDEWEEFWEGVEHSPAEAIAKAKSRAYYPKTRSQETEVRS
jgi:hypothetical protein